MEEPNWEVIADLAIKAVDDAKEAISRTAFLASDPMEATLVTMIVHAVLRGEQEGVMEGLADSPAVVAASKLANAVAEAIKDAKHEELKLTLPLIREALRRVRQK